VEVNTTSLKRETHDNSQLPRAETGGSALACVIASKLRRDSLRLVGWLEKNVASPKRAGLAEARRRRAKAGFWELAVELGTAKPALRESVWSVSMGMWNSSDKLCGAIAVSVVLLTTAFADSQQVPSAAPAGTQVVLLGTGTPPADPDRSGPATAVVVNGTPYLVDFGAGVVRRAKSAVVDRGITALDPVNLRVVFVTHLHSDHTVGYPDLILTPWVLGRRVPLEVYGPTGIKGMTDHVLEAYRADFEARTRDRALYTVGAFPEGHAVNSHEIRAGVVYKDANVTVTAFPTKHAMESYGYRFDTPDRSIVISGDTNPTQTTIDACRGCDVLIHEVLTLEWLAKRLDFQGYAAQHHTTTAQLTELATKAKPRLLILYHASLSLRPAVDAERSTPARLLSEMSSYSGRVVVGRDLDVY
jgi:ribonuclease BN (tRNA processing enzyme)